MQIKFSFIYQYEIVVDDYDVINAHNLYMINNGFELNIIDENADIWVDTFDVNIDNAIIVNIKLIENDINIINKKIKKLNKIFDSFKNISQLN